MSFKSLTAEELQAIKRRVASATPGPWFVQHVPFNGFDDPIITTANGTYVAQTAYDMQSDTLDHNVDEDAVFIAHSREDIERLLEEIRYLRSQLERWPPYKP